ncbi:hypothetical protein LTR53_017696 [Teratosphaeriaceae sp. CCFEE 6253]|nr:hypothetical protein LTR53_017696 [Teratosphaeriaceae sp. CCFEE 6253]
MTSISSTRHLNLDLPPSCIAFCPARPQYLVIGTYHLHGNTTVPNGEAAENAQDSEHGPQRRSGSLILFELKDDEIIHVATEATPDFAILDLQWSPHSPADGELLAVATSTGLLVFYELRREHDQTRLVPRGMQRVCDASILVLSLAWHPTQAGVVGVTLSDGRICLCASTSDKPWADEGATLSVTTVHEHSLEAWTLAFRQHDDGMDVLSGGDDLVLQLSTADGDGVFASRWQDRKLHQAGVTAILPIADDLVVTGSYDDHIRLISTPSVGRRRVLAEMDLGGGVWRLRLISDSAGKACAAAAEGSRSMVILASCMHAGSRVLRLGRSPDTEDWSFEILARFEEHKSMNYGSDVQPGLGIVKAIVSTSFYDKLLCLWRFDTGHAG